MTSEEIKAMIKQAKENKLYMTRHAKIRSLQRGLSTADVIDAVNNIKRIIRIDVSDEHIITYKIEGINDCQLAIIIKNNKLVVITVMRKNKKGCGKRNGKMCNV